MRPQLVILAVIGAISVLRLGNAAVSDKHLEWWVNQRVSKLVARFSDRPFDEIGWATDFRQAYALAKEHKRPLFLFTYDGIGIDSGRC